MKKRYDVSQPDLCCTECCTPSTQEPVRRLGQIDGHEVVYLCQECTPCWTPSCEKSLE